MAKEGIGPGAYIARRREAAGFTVEQVAARISTEPHQLPERDRVLWLQMIERDQAPLTADTVRALRLVFRFDLHVLQQLQAIATSPVGSVTAPRLCRICACSQLDPCITAAGACAWAASDLCTACAPSQSPPGAGRPVASASNDLLEQKGAVA